VLNISVVTCASAYVCVQQIHMHVSERVSKSHAHGNVPL